MAVIVTLRFVTVSSEVFQKIKYFIPIRGNQINILDMEETEQVLTFRNFVYVRKYYTYLIL